MVENRWRFAQTEELRRRRADEFKNDAAIAQSQRNTASWHITGQEDTPGERAAREADRSGGGGFLGKIKGVGGKVLGAGLEAINVGSDIVSGAFLTPFTDPKVDPETGQVSREFTIGKGFKILGKDLITLGGAGAGKADIRAEREVLGTGKPSGIRDVLGEIRSVGKQIQASENIPIGIRTAIALGSG